MWLLAYPNVIIRILSVYFNNIFKIDHLTNVQVLEIVDITNIKETLAKKILLHWTGRV